MSVPRAFLLTLLLTLSVACVKKSDHDRLMGQARQRLLDEQAARQADMVAAGARISTLEQEIARLQGEIAARDATIAEENRKIAELSAKLNDQTALSAQLQSTLERAGKSVDKLATEKGDLSKALEETKQRLEELRKAQEAAQRRADLFREIALRFKKMIDAGELSVVFRDGRMVLQLRNDVLFDSGKVDVKAAGKKALEEVAAILAPLEDRAWQVAGHTDNVPISSARFPSNWELSTARSVAVVKYLIEQGMPAERLSAAGYGQYDPVADNGSDEGRAKNRRIEIVLQPNLEELIKTPVK